jgi:hypothetical protein
VVTKGKVALADAGRDGGVLADSLFGAVGLADAPRQAAGLGDSGAHAGLSDSGRGKVGLTDE